METIWNYLFTIKFYTMKTIKTLLTIVIMIASTTFVKAQQDAKYHYHDFGSKTTTTTGYTVCSFTCAYCIGGTASVTDAKYHYHDLAKTTQTGTAKVCVSMDNCIESDNGQVVNAKSHYHDLVSTQAVKGNDCVSSF